MDIRLEKLSHWGRVAFVAKCARRAMPFFKAGWPAASAERQSALERAVRLAEESVAAGRPADGLKAASLDAGVAAGAPLVPHLYTMVDFDRDEREPPADRRSAEVASLAANVVRHAADAARSDGEESLRAAREAYRFVLNLIDHADQRALIELIEFDFAECLRQFPGRPWWKFW